MPTRMPKQQPEDSRPKHQAAVLIRVGGPMRRRLRIACAEIGCTVQSLGMQALLDALSRLESQGAVRTSAPVTAIFDNP
jgi:hypothetical protein